MKIKISHFQLAALLIVSALFSMSSGLPDMSEHSMTKFASLLITSGLLLLIYLPLIVFTARNQDGVLQSNFGAVKWIVGSVIVFRLLFAALLTAVQLEYAITKTIMPYLAPIFFTTVVFLSALYSMNKGVQSAARVAPVALTLYLLVIALVSVFIWKNVDIIRIHSPLAMFGGNDNGGMFWGSLNDAVKNDELFFFAVLSGFVRSEDAQDVQGKVRGQSYKSVLFYYFPIVIIVGLWLNFLYNAVFGRFLGSVLYPMYTISSFADFNIIERMDGVFATATILGGIFKIILVFICVRVILFELFAVHSRDKQKDNGGGGQIKRIRAAKITAAILLVATAALVRLLLGREQWFNNNSGMSIFYGVPMITAAFILPAAALVFKKNTQKGQG
ncbi:MAG: hypothetical protein FWH07_03970 [Oscillospiraceae bacterium]|nr:hypothetical protein [Oscillospiraceae bacterium]